MALRHKPSLVGHLMLSLEYMKKIVIYWYCRFFPNHYFDNHRPTTYRVAPNRDFGNMVNKGQQTCVSVDSEQQLQTLVKKAQSDGTPINICASGHSSNGLTLSRQGGLRVNIKGLKPSYRMVDAETVEFSGVPRIAQLAEFLSQHGKVLPVVGDQLDLTLGGYLSAGGIGFNSVEFGLLSHHVTYLRLLTPSGEMVECTREENPGFFHAVLGGQGQLGIILSGRIRVIPHQPVYMRTDIIKNFQWEQIVPTLAQDKEANWGYHFFGISIANNNPIALHLVGKRANSGTSLKEFDQVAQNVVGKDIISLGGARQLAPKYNRFTMPIGYGPMLLKSPYWVWNEYIIPYAEFETLMPRLAPFLTLPQAIMYCYLGNFPSQAWHKHHSFLASPSLHPGEERTCVCFGLAFAFYGGDESDLRQRQQQLDELFPYVIAQRGLPYYHGYHPSLRPDMMETMYPHYATFVAMKKKWDPNNILNSDWVTQLSTNDDPGVVYESQKELLLQS